MCQSRPNDAIPNPGGHLGRPLEKYEPQMSLAAIGTPRQLSEALPPLGIRSVGQGLGEGHLIKK